MAAIATGFNLIAIELALSKKVRVNTFSVNSPKPFLRMPYETFSIISVPFSDARSGDIMAYRATSLYFLLGGKREMR